MLRVNALEKAETMTELKIFTGEPEATVPDFEPLADFMLIEEIPQNKTAGGIALPDNAKTAEPSRGKVLRVGPGIHSQLGHKIPMQCVVGDVVWLMFAYAEPIPVTFNKKKYILARDRDVVGRNLAA